MSSSNELKDLLKALEQTLAPFSRIASVLPGQAGAVQEVEQLLQKAPDPERLTRGLEEALRSLAAYCAKDREGREERFRLAETAYVKSMRELSKVTELGESWRIGKLELAADRAASKVRVLYNGEVVVDWQAVSSEQEIRQSMLKADQLLRSAAAALSDDQLIAVAADAFALATGFGKSARVTMGEFYRSFRLALLRLELKSGKPDKKLQTVELPKWQFLFHVDRYRGASGPDKLQFEPGSQADTAKGLAMTVNGLSEDGHLKKVCYVVRGGTHA